MQTSSLVHDILKYYPKIFFACHTRHVRDEKTKLVLSAHQASILDHLDNIEPVRLTHLASHMGVTPSTMSLTIDRLEKKGFVKRNASSEDKRIVNLILTTNGVRIKDAKSVLDPDLVKNMIDPLPEDIRRKAIEGLKVLAAAADEAMIKKSKSKHWAQRKNN